MKVHGSHLLNAYTSKCNIEQGILESECPRHAALQTLEGIAIEY